MKNTKLYFILSAVVNVLFIVTALVLFFNPDRTLSLLRNYEGDPLNPYLGFVLMFTPIVLLFIATLFFFWGLGLVAKKMRNGLVVGGLIACLASFSVLGVLIEIRNEQLDCSKHPGACMNPN